MADQQKAVKGTRTQLVLAFAAVYIIWGSTYLAIRFALETLPPFLMAGVRFVVAGLILYAVQRLRSGTRPTAAQWRATFIIGGLLITVGNGAVVWSELRIPSGIAAIVVAVMPCWMVLLDWLWERNDRPGWKTVVGLLLGFGGLALLIVPGIRGEAGSLDIHGIGAVMVGSICWAVGSIYSKRVSLPTPQLLATGMEMLCGGALLVLLGLVMGEASHVSFATMTMHSVLALAYLTVFGSLIAFSAYIWLLHRVSAAQVSTYAYVNPLVAVLLGWAMAHEALTPVMAAATAFIIAGVVLITLSNRSETEAAEA
ncbi:MAG: drug/metabolite exporter YedA [Longimicrobiales bacterium]